MLIPLSILGFMLHRLRRLQCNLRYQEQNLTKLAISERRLQSRRNFFLMNGLNLLITFFGPVNISKSLTLCWFTKERNHLTTSWFVIKPWQTALPRRLDILLNLSMAIDLDFSLGFDCTNKDQFKVYCLHWTPLLRFQGFTFLILNHRIILPNFQSQYPKIQKTQ